MVLEPQKTTRKRHDGEVRLGSRAESVKGDLMQSTGSCRPMAENGILGEHSARSREAGGSRLVA